MIEIEFPSRGMLRLEYLAFDVNGTIALDGQLVPGVRERLEKLRPVLEIWLVSADTQGTLATLAANLRVTARTLQPGNEATQKAALADELGAEGVVAISNGANDVMIMRQAALGIAVLGGEGLATACLTAANIIAPNIAAALDLLLYPRRLIATLRT